jgi:hypothetical protein
MQPYSNPTRSIIDDDLNSFKNGRRPDLKKNIKEDNLNFYENETQPQKKIM